MTDQVIAWIKPADPVIPGLVNVTLSTGETYSELTMGQIKQLAAKHGWELRPDR